MTRRRLAAHSTMVAIAKRYVILSAEHERIRNSSFKRERIAAHLTAVSPAGSVGASASQRCPPDTRTAMTKLLKLKARLYLQTRQSVDKPQVLFLRRLRRIYVFSLTRAAKKHLVSEKPLIQRFFKGTGVVLAGIECSPKISDFRANGIPVGERVDFFDTLTAPFGAATTSRFYILFSP